MEGGSLMERLLADVRVSIDVGCHRHRVAVGLSNGEVLDEFEVKHGSPGFDDFLRELIVISAATVAKCWWRWKATMAGLGHWTRWFGPMVIACSISTI
jgi:hypothetical protein